ncbi:MAG: hypothetical protein V7651_18380 [Hyphomonas oceanitis]|uniref:hypothetical protein n=1 Tax=Hyphomonas oceanitis TaxID=81033 RepID=UPI003002D58F
MAVHESESPERQWKPFGGVFTVLGALAGSLSIISLIQNWSDASLATLAAEVLAYYRAIADQLKGLLFDWWTIKIWPNWQLPSWSIDVLNLYVLSATSMVRQVYYELPKNARTVRNVVAAIPTVRVVFAPLGWIYHQLDALAGTISPWARTQYIERGVSAQYRTPKAYIQPRRNHALALVAGSAPVIGAVLFFVFNAFL